MGDLEKDRNNEPLFVLPKHPNLKEEIAEYKYLNVKHYKEEVVPKAEAFRKT